MTALERVPHEYGPSRVGHGEAQCLWCYGTNRENAIISPNHCEARAKAQASNTTSAAPEVAGAKEAGRFTGSYTADNDHSNSVAADGRSRAQASISSKERLSHRLLNIAGDLSEIASNPPQEMDSQAMARIASLLIALAGQVRLGEDIDPTRVPAETEAPPTDPDHAELLKKIPRVGAEFVAEVRVLSRWALERRVLIQKDWLHSYSCCLDGLGVKVGFESCRDPKDIRRVVEESRSAPETRAVPPPDKQFLALGLPLGFVLVAQCASCGVYDEVHAKHFAWCAAAPGAPIRPALKAPVGLTAGGPLTPEEIASGLDDDPHSDLPVEAV